MGIRRNLDAQQSWVWGFGLFMVYGNYSSSELVHSGWMAWDWLQMAGLAVQMKLEIFAPLLPTLLVVPKCPDNTKSRFSTRPSFLSLHSHTSRPSYARYLTAIASMVDAKD